MSRSNSITALVVPEVVIVAALASLSLISCQPAIEGEKISERSLPDWQPGAGAAVRSEGSVPDELLEADIFAWVTIEDIGEARSNSESGAVPIPTESLQESLGILYTPYTLAITDVIGINLFSPSTTTAQLSSIEDIDDLNGAVIADSFGDSSDQIAPDRTPLLDTLQVEDSGIVFLSEYAPEFYENPTIEYPPISDYLRTQSAALSTGGDEYRAYVLFSWYDVSGGVATSRHDGTSVDLATLLSWISQLSSEP